MPNVNRPNEVTIPRWFDRHLHLRDGDLLEAVLPYTLASKPTGAVIMGNLHERPISTIERAINYQGEIRGHLAEGCDFRPIMTCYLTDDTTPREVADGFKQDVWRAGKLYFAGPGGTYNAKYGVKDVLGRYRVFAAMEAKAIPLLIHLEAPGDDVDDFDREIRGLDRILVPLRQSFRGLPIVIEHVSDGRVAEYIASNVDPNTYATVTAHHLMIDRNAMYKGGMNPIYYCLPLPKRREDRELIRKIVTSGHPRFGAGTDSAPHSRVNKSKYVGCPAGIFTAPAAPELYATVFDEENALSHLGDFMSKNLLHLYGVEASKETMTLVREPYTVPELVGSAAGGIIVFKGGETLPWKLAGR
jgi:dihydroorotase